MMFSKFKDQFKPINNFIWTNLTTGFYILHVSFAEPIGIF